ncbi:hypothetical protein K9N68_19020 [Kovacikia minuta CCNUW1]|uniref:hypothetical protein n=1 Tax=Kovacikia minuta TaxID=2931930 RepID=UPI001CCF0539|nr:hypothetical protein [Kovacikia minuta]UBF23842.1 hypothetical protein K9N68_19020 [Kovacikia minuta CCNUW1]
MYDLTNFTLREMTACGIALRKIGVGAETMEAVADRIVRHFYEGCVNPQGDKSLALVRLFKTHSYEELEPELCTVVQQALGKKPDVSSMKCLTLLATAGEHPNWNARRASQGHQAIPLVSEELVSQSPMISQLIRQMGLEMGTVLEPDPSVIVDLEQKTFNVFHIPEAQGSPFVPAQAEFVIPYGIRSVLGFGGMLPSGNLLAIIMFSKTPIPRNAAGLFEALALNAKMALLPFDGNAVFTEAKALSGVGN